MVFVLFVVFVPVVPLFHSGPNNAPPTHYPAFYGSFTWDRLQFGVYGNGLGEIQFHNCFPALFNSYFTGNYVQYGNC